MGNFDRSFWSDEIYNDALLDGISAELSKIEKELFLHSTASPISDEPERISTTGKPSLKSGRLRGK